MEKEESPERRSVLTVTYVDVSAFSFTGDDHSLGEDREFFVIEDNLTRDYEPNFYADIRVLSHSLLFQPLRQSRAGGKNFN